MIGMIREIEANIQSEIEKSPEVLSVSKETLLSLSLYKQRQTILVEKDCQEKCCSI